MIYDSPRIKTWPRPKPATGRANSGSGSKAKWFVLIGILGLLGGISWGASYFRTDPHLARVHELRQQLFSPGQELTSEQRSALFSEMRKESEQLTSEQRREMWRSGQEDFRKRMEQRINDYFTLPPEQRQAALDKEIDDMERERQRWEKRRQEREKEEAAKAANGQSSGSSSGSDSNNRRDGGSQTSSGGSSGSSNGGRGPRGPRTEEQRNEWRKRMLDNTSPEMRAKMAVHRQEMDQRRRERGLPPMPSRRPF